MNKQHIAANRRRNKKPAMPEAVDPAELKTAIAKALADAKAKLAAQAPADKPAAEIKPAQKRIDYLADFYGTNKSKETK